MMKVLVHTKMSEQQLDTLRSVSPELDIVRELDAERAREVLKDAEILCTFRLPGPLEEARALRWIQLVSAGAEHLFEAGISDLDIKVTTVSGIHGPAIAEYSLCMMVMLARRLPQIMRESAQRQWRPSRTRTYYGDELRGKTLGIVGFGRIGQQVASVSRCLGMEVLGFRRTPVGQGERSSLGEELFSGREGLLRMLPRCDFVVLVAPLTAATRSLIGEAELRAMKPTAHLINVARGRLVDEPVLVRALREGWIAGAALDVFATEPLPADSELWDLPNAIVTPHMAGDFIDYLERAAEVFRENLRRYLAGEPMINVLDKQRGY
jgi:phosphoglycerate dehydrogenase-like enzyme